MISLGDTLNLNFKNVQNEKKKLVKSLISLEVILQKEVTRKD